MKEFPLKSWSTRELSCSVMSTRDKSIVWMNWFGSSSLSCACSNSRFLTRLLTSGESACLTNVRAKGGACELTMLTLSLSVTFSVNCLTAASLITKSCQQCWPIHTCSVYKVVQRHIWGLVVYFRVPWSQLISVCSSEKILKSASICQSCSNKKWSQFFMTHSVVYVFWLV